ncbi:MAG: hypothetical protein NXY57DRAFT_306926 [Lentinula lateritia]|uniref:Uncharacterized protein n=1 Tax=Lentinula lateritia TaxID=40482 RepID=A0ABQ8VBN9_9AGAR|nr:MAG: hypothetical protein NXY57DRAFT_306926 [Lentinula lateritia]KAJ4486493.1 hypothetical protein C8R41DRAFT_438983 [Lentinula lateritia]
MEASLGEPFLLSSYTTTNKASKSSKTSGRLPSIFASHHGTGGSSDGHITVAAQGDGVHVLDLSTLHPIISHTLGPTITFSCPSVTRSELQSANHVCTTYAAISSSPEISEDEKSRTIWMWKEGLSSSVADRVVQRKKAVVLPHSISGLYIDSELPSRVLVTSSQGDLTVLHSDLQIQATRTSKCESLKTFVLSRRNCTFLPPRGSVPSSAAIVISFVTLNANVRIQILAVDLEDQFRELGNIELPIKYQSFCDVSFSGTGFFSVLLTDGTWSSFELKRSDDTLYLNSIENIQLTSLSFILSSNGAEASILALGSSYVLLAGSTGSSSNREVVLLFWDLSFSVLLASHTLPLPPYLTNEKVSITLVGALSSSNVLLLISPISIIPGRRQSQGQSSSSSSVWVVPVTVPPSSSIANAIGRAAAATPWLAVSDAQGDSHDAGRTKLVNEMRSAMDRNQPENANNAFFEWEKQAVLENSQHKLPEMPTLYGYNFTKEILNIVLQPSKPTKKTLYSSKIVQHLLEKKVVSAGMVEADLLGVFRSHNDWKSICSALTRVSDLQEAEIIECLCFVLARYRQARRPTSSDAMQIDSVSSMNDDCPTLQAFLSLVVRYSCSLNPLRAAFRRYLSDVDDVICLLEMLDSWIGQWAGRDTRLLPSNKTVKQNELGVYITTLESQDSLADIPSMLQITFFLQCLIDTSFINLIQTPSAQRILRGIQAHIDPEIKYIDQTEQLRGPLELFVKAQTKAIKEAKAASEGIKVPTPDRKQRRKLLHEQAGATIGLYRLEELTL